jgi:hypothetical protein
MNPYRKGCLEQPVLGAEEKTTSLDLPLKDLALHGA